MRSEILYGIHPVQEALRAGRRRIDRIYVGTEKPSERIRSVLNLAGEKSVAISEVKPGFLRELCATGTHQGLVASVGPYPMIEFEDLLDGLRSAQHSRFFLVLDGITDPQNLGALLRTALCAGVDGVLLPKDRSVHPTPTVCKASAGAMEHLRIARVTNVASCLRMLQKRQVWIAGLEPNASTLMYDIDWTLPIAIVIGAEGKGIRPLVQAQCDWMVAIPQASGFNSLNASVAGALVMYEVLRARRLQNTVSGRSE
ncbi:23S rRNA (guanosine(2251)-2'-O)-methyltransferase RlmB [Desulfatirhabdium butyrativorans]|uniref:23S rRNA (guanosine(2251)-2'-O)-methyltransferase RlmB n=1 Tax=Desulfatirhabdium butyrativorans TaxID=340467 RepID=UPI0003F7FDED|nr:23S rRNA (guanosine(2251)-2'-O)-methyltransferase RlmB [Desulfatirhabdium butyrativorans]